MRDRIFLRDHLRQIEIGAFVEERANIQSVRFNVELELDQPRPASDEDVDHILSYDVIIEAIDRVLSQQRFNLLEYLADQLAGALFAHAQLSRVHVTIEKLDRVSGALGVSITRDRDELSPALDISKPKTNLLMVACDEGLPEDLALTVDTVLLPLLDRTADNDTAQHLLTLELDQWAWRLGAAYNLPVVDSQTEANALIARRQGFVRAYGKALFSQTEAAEYLDGDTLINWAVGAMRATRVEIYRYEPANGFSSPLFKYGLTQ